MQPEEGTVAKSMVLAGKQFALSPALCLSSGGHVSSLFQVLVSLIYKMGIMTVFTSGDHGAG